MRRNQTLNARLRMAALEDRTNPAPAVALSNNSLVSFDTSTPGTATTVAVSNLNSGDSLVGIDYRPQNGGLYGLATDGLGGVRLYALNASSGKATALGAAAQQFQDEGGNPVAITGSKFGIDFNPTVDRLRIVTDTGVNFRMNPNTGLIVDGDTTKGGVQADGSVNGPTTQLDATAYTNNAPNATVTTQYTLDSASGKLFIQNPPNTGTQTNGVAITENGTVLNFTSVNGFDIPAGVNTTASNTAVTAGSAFAAIAGGTNPFGLYSIDLTNGKATFQGKIAGGLTAVQGLAVNPLSAGTGVPFIAVAGGNVVRFNSTTPGTTKTATVTGLAAGETLVGIDTRPATGQLYALGIDATADKGTLYTLDPQGTATQNGVVTAVGTLSPVGGATGLVSLVDASGKAIDLPDTATAGYGIDFNPTVDKLRVVGGNLNFRLNPLTGTAVDGDTTNAGTQPDLAISGSTTKVDATAYTNSFNGTTVTTQYTLDASTDKLFIQNPPNNGTQTTPVSVTLGGKALDFSNVNGFDIPSTVKVSTSNTVASGLGYAALTVAGKTSLYAIDLTTGAAANLGFIGDGATPVVGLTGADVPAALSAGLVGTRGIGVGSDAGTGNTAGLFNPDQSKINSFTPFVAGFTGGVRTASADFNFDGVADLVAATGPGVSNSLVILNGRDGTELFRTQPFEATFTGGLYVSAGDVNGDGRPDVVVSPDETGGPRVDVFSGADFLKLASFFGIDDKNFRGGARTAVGDVNGDGVSDLAVAAGFGGGPRVAVFDGKTVSTSAPVKLFNDFFAFEQTLRNGAFIALGDTDGDGRADVIAGGGPGGGPRVIVLNGALAVSSGGATLTPIANFFASDTNSRGGIRVSVKDLDNDAKADIVVGAGSKSGGRVTAYAGSTITSSGTPPELFNFDPLATTGGVYVGNLQIQSLRPVFAGEGASRGGLRVRRLLTRLATGLHIAAFAVLCLIASPIILFHFGVSAVQGWIERQWPDSNRAQAISFWLGLLAPLVLVVLLMVALGYYVAHVRAIKQAAPRVAINGGS